MEPKLSFRLPSRRSLGWILVLIVAGSLLGLGLNAVSPVGINMRIALNLDQPDAPAAEAQP